ncbi:MAG: DUF1924 domain-containing protein [Rhodospirillales bacterium]|nr:DUF1924 domain-containing protein [Rhodospirillales bacterium]
MKTLNKTNVITAVVLLIGGLSPNLASANSARDTIISGFSSVAELPVSAERGKALFESSPAAGKPDTPSCTTCHGASPMTSGMTRAGKPIEPMAVSVTAERFTDLKKVQKWFRRNCKSVLGRECTAQEKGDFLTFMSSR